jgi:tRNA pseudouridine38-40 synthase
MRYFLQVSYKGTKYAGFQIQQNATTIQGEVEKALSTVLRAPVELTGSSRTDAGVHALQNFFHFDLEHNFKPAIIYNLNAMLPRDIVVESIFPVAATDHCRFLATAREYKYFITTTKNAFVTETAWYYPYTVDADLLNQAAQILFKHTDYTSFSKRNTQVATFNCTIVKSLWSFEKDNLVYNIKANRFLRGMVRGLVGTMLLAGRRKISLIEFENIILSKDCTKASFATPAHGLFLVQVEYPPTIPILRIS